MCEGEPHIMAPSDINNLATAVVAFYKCDGGREEIEIVGERLEIVLKSRVFRYIQSKQPQFTLMDAEDVCSHIREDFLKELSCRNPVLSSPTELSRILFRSAICRSINYYKSEYVVRKYKLIGTKRSKCNAAQEDNRTIDSLLSATSQPPKDEDQVLWEYLDSTTLTSRLVIAAWLESKGYKPRTIQRFFGIHRNTLSSVWNKKIAKALGLTKEPKQAQREA